MINISRIKYSPARNIHLNRFHGLCPRVNRAGMEPGQDFRPVTRPDLVAFDPVTRPDPFVERCETNPRQRLDSSS